MKKHTDNATLTHSFADFHIHILPQTDDGAQSVPESLAMFRCCAEQNIRRVVATPHFYPEEESPQDFLARRSAAVEILRTAGLPQGITLYTGAEVAYYKGIGVSDEISKLCITGTPYLLVEMPFEPWSDTVLSELFRLRYRMGLCPIVAHLERYLPMQEKHIAERLADEDILIQCNAGHLGDRPVRKLFSRGLVHLVGSDAHNLTDRVPDLASGLNEAFSAVDSYLQDELEIRTNRILRDAIPAITT